MSAAAAPQPAVAEADKGYFATLGVTFRADEATIGKAYKKLALKMHPDKNPGPAAVDQFQKITTSYHVIMDEQKRKNYLRLFMLRCYMSQECPMEGEGLRPHYAFMVEKSKFAIGGRSDRLITIDLLERKMASYKKDALKKEFPLTAINGVDSNEKALELTVSFSDNHPYFIKARCAIQFYTLLAVLTRIVEAGNTGEMTDESLQLMIDDTGSPPSSVHKSKVIKRAERSVGSSLVADWQPRFMVMGSTHLILFRDVELAQMVNIVPLSMIKFVPDTRDGTCFQLMTSYWRASFRVLTEEVAVKWKMSLKEMQDAERELQPEAMAAGTRTEGSAKLDGIRKSSRPTRNARPSVLFTEKDLTNLDRPVGAEAASALPPTPSKSLSGSVKRFDFNRQDSLCSASSSAAQLSLPAPELAPWETEFDHGWIKYRDDEGRAYYYNKETQQTQWTLPEGIADSAEANGAASSGELSLPKTEESSDERQAQLAALRDEEEAKDSEMDSELAFSQAKGSLLALMQSLERGLLKARRGVEADRPLNDLAPMFEQMQVTFSKMAATGAQFESAAMRREDTQRAFMSNKSAYLSGLQAHVLGEDNEDTVAGKIFRKGAYVAGTFNKMTNMRGVL